MEAETSYFSLINVNATHFTSTPIVCGHAEACPSTTYDKSISNDARTSRARWPGTFFPAFFCPIGGGAPSGCYPVLLPTLNTLKK